MQCLPKTPRRSNACIFPIRREWCRQLERSASLQCAHHHSQRTKLESNIQRDFQSTFSPPRQAILQQCHQFIGGPQSQIPVVPFIYPPNLSSDLLTSCWVLAHHSTPTVAHLIHACAMLMCNGRRGIINIGVCRWGWGGGGKDGAAEGQTPAKAFSAMNTRQCPINFTSWNGGELHRSSAGVHTP